jgi:hypothetical protein
MSLQIFIGKLFTLASLSSLDIQIFKVKIGLNSVPVNRKEESQSFGSNRYYYRLNST